MYSLKDVKSFVEQEDIRFLRLAFCDVTGTPKNLSVMPEQLDRVDADSVTVDASVITDFADVTHGDLFLHPDYSTLSILPWRPTDGRVARIFCDLQYPDGTPYEYDCRKLLKDAIADAEGKGLHFRFGTEMEFYLFKTDENGNPTKTPFDNAGYLDIAPADKGENVRREICLTLYEMGMIPEASHHEDGPGQNEIDFHYSDPLKAADQAITFRSVVETIATRNGLFADFAPLPLEGQAPSGMHINISVQSGDGRDVNQQIIGGILKHIREITVFLNPKEESYHRLNSQSIPGYLSWAPENRTQLVRVPAAKGDYRRIELRSPDCLANPYLVYTLLIRAIMDGIGSNADPGEPLNCDLSLQDHPELQKLPASLEQARKVAGESTFVTTSLPKGILKQYKIIK